MEIVCLILFAYWLVLIARILLSWATMFWSPPTGLSPAIRAVYDLTEPVLAPLRRAIPPLGGLDLSPLVIFIALGIIRGSLGC